MSPAGLLNFRPTGRNLLLLARGDLQLPIRKAITAAMAQNAAVQQRGLRLERGGEEREINLEVIPISHAPGYYLVMFERTSPAAINASDAPSAPPEPESLEEENARLQQELAESRQGMLAIVQEHETALEEQRAANEEISSANEELQSTNEELGTAKEELQSANEELTTVNEELQNRNQELGVLLADLNNLFAAVNTPILMIDRSLLLRRYTPAAEQALGLSSADLGRLISDLPARTKVPQLEQLMHEVLDTLTVAALEFQDHDGCWWSLAIRPYLTLDHRIEGVVLTFVSVDSLKRSLQAAEESRDYAQAIVETVREPLVVLSPDLHVESANIAFYRTFQLATGNTEGKLLYELDDGHWDISRLRHLLEEVLSKSLFFEDFAVEHEFPRIGLRSMSFNARRILQQDRSTQRLLLAITDITERKLAENKLLRSHANLERFGYVVAHDLQEPIRTVGNCAQLLARRYKGKLDPEADEFIEQVEQGVIRTTTMIQDLLAYSQAGKSENEPFKTISAEAALKEALWNLQAAVNESGALIMHNGLPKISYASGPLTQVFQNLVGNAIKYRREEPPQIHVSAERNEREWVFSVRDNGIGFDVQYAETIFGVFKRLESPQYPGTGIGLAICQRIIERFGGRIWAESVRGVGSTFYFTIHL